MTPGLNYQLVWSAAMFQALWLVVLALGVVDQPLLSLVIYGTFTIVFKQNWICRHFDRSGIFCLKSAIASHGFRVNILYHARFRRDTAIFGSILVQLLVKACSRSLLIICFQDTRRMCVFRGSIWLLALLLQSNGERVTFTLKHLINKVCKTPSTASVHVREHQYCHWHCMKNTDCFGVNYNIGQKKCWLLAPCDAIHDYSGYIFTVYGTQEYIRSLLQNQWHFSGCCTSYLCSGPNLLTCNNFNPCVDK